MTPREVLDAAADYIEAHGWIQRYVGSDGGPRCVPGSIYSVGTDGDTRSLAVDIVHERCGNRISHWNDAPGRTQAEVVAMLRGEP